MGSLRNIGGAGVFSPTRNLPREPALVARRGVLDDLGNAPGRLMNDFAALSLRATAYHILQPMTKEGKAAAQGFKEEIEQETENGAFALDILQHLAKVNSTDDDSRSRGGGGLLAENFSPGTFRTGSEGLEELCFTGEIGKPIGPILTPFGWSVLLITERCGCRKDDPLFTRLKKCPDGRGRLVASDPDETTTEGSIADVTTGIMIVTLSVAFLFLMVPFLIDEDRGGPAIMSPG